MEFIISDSIIGTKHGKISWCYNGGIDSRTDLRKRRGTLWFECLRWRLSRMLTLKYIWCKSWHVSFNRGAAWCLHVALHVVEPYVFATVITRDLDRSLLLHSLVVGIPVLACLLNVLMICLTASDPARVRDLAQALSQGPDGLCYGRKLRLQVLQLLCSSMKHFSIVCACVLIIYTCVSTA